MSAETENLFETAAVEKYRFSTGRGELLVENLYDLKLTDLDRIAKDINRNLQATEEESFIPTAGRKTGSKSLRNKLEIVKAVIQRKVDEDTRAKDRAAKQAKLAVLKGIAEQKQGEALTAKSLDELTAMIAELSKE